MSSLIKIKRSAVQGKSPNTSIMELGELALNTYDGKLFFKKDDGTQAIVTIQEVTEDNLVIDTSSLDNSTATYLSGVLSDMDAAITSAVGGGLSSVDISSEANNSVGILTLSDSSSSTSSVTFSGSGATSVSSNATHVIISSNNEYVTGGEFDVDTGELKLTRNGGLSDVDIPLDGRYLTNSTNTSSISEGTNLYYTDTRARSAISASGDLSYNSNTGVISYSTPSIPQSGVDFDPVGTDNSTDVTLAGTYDYLTLTGQQITLNQIDYSTDITNTPTIGDATVSFTGDSVILVGATTSFDLNDTTNSTISLTANTAAISITESQISDLGTYVHANTVGEANGIASLDENGLVPSSQLPSYVDDVLEYANSSSFPVSGEVGKIYVDLAENDVYRWSGSAYIIISDAVSSADQATRLATARSIILSGDVTGSATFDGSANVTITANVGDDNHNHTVSTITDFGTATNTAIDARVTKSFVDALNIDADTLDGANGTFYLDYTNFTNTPTIPSSGVDFDPVGTDNSTDVTLAGTYDYLSIANQTITLNQIDYTTDISNLPTLYTTADANTDIDARVTKAFVDALNVDADTLDGNDSSYFTNASNISTGTLANARLPDLAVSDFAAASIQTSAEAFSDSDTVLMTAAAVANKIESYGYITTETDSQTLTWTSGNTTLAISGGNSVNLSSLLDDTDTTYELVSPGTSGVLRLSDSTNANDDITFIGSDAATVSSNSSHIIISSTDTTYSNGAGLGLSGTTFSHLDTSSVSNLTASSRRYVTGLTFDDFGHVTGVTTGTETVTNTDTNTTYDLVSPGSGVLRLSDSANANDNITFVGSGATSVSSNSSHITISSTDTNTTYTSGTGLDLNGTVFSHSDTSSVSSLTASGRTYVTGLTFDTFGHVTGVTTGTETVVNTDTNTTYGISAVDSGANAIIRLTAGGSGSGTDDVTLVAGSNITLTPSGDNITITATDTNTTYSNGAGIGLSGTTFSHLDTSSASNLTASSRRYVTGLTFDTFGHVTGYSTDTETVVNTDTNTTYDLVSPGSGVLRLSDSSNSNDSITFLGSGATSVSSNASHIVISSTDTNTTYSAGNNMVLSGTEFSVNANPTFTTTKLTAQDPHPSHSEGQIFYSGEYKALTYHNDISDVSLQVGLEEWIRVYNNTANTIPNGTPVYDTGAFGETITVAPADSLTEEKAQVIGIATHDIAASTEGVVTVRGLVAGVDTSGLTVGQKVHMSPNGGLQNEAPTYPYFPVDLGWCVVSDASEGYLYVTIENHTFEQFRVTGNQHIDGDLQIVGDLVVTGTQSVVSQASLNIDDSFVYLNSGDTIGLENTTFSGTGLNDAYFNNHYEGTTTKTFYVRIDGVGAGTGGVDTFEWSTDNFATTEATDVDLEEEVLLSDNICIHFNALTGHTLNDTWSGTAAPLNVDSGWFSNRNTGTSGVGYTHMGIFFDVSDNKFKVVEEYDPEPSGTINTADSSFNLGTLVADSFEGTANNATNLNGQDASYYLNFNNLTNKPDPTLTLNGDVSGSATFTNLGNATLTVTVADDSHNHVISNIDGLQTALNNKVDETVNVLSGGGLTGGGALTANVTISHADTSSQASLTALTGAAVVSDIDLDTYGHITNLATRNLTLANLGYTGATNADYYNGWDLFTDGTSRGRITSAENVNFVGGTNVSLSYSATNNTITINSTDTNTDTNTTYDLSSVANTSNGVIRLSAGGSGSGNDDVPVFGSGATSITSNSTGIYISSTDTNTNTTYSAGNGIGLSGTTFSVAAGSGLTQNSNGLAHSDTSTVSNLTASGRTYVTGLTFDTFGHVTGVTTGTETVVNTDTTYSAGTLLDLSGTTFNVDLSELSTSTTDGDGDFFVVVDSVNAQRKLTKANINISGFNNDAGYTTNIGDITGVSAGSGLTGGGTSGSVTLSHADTSSQASVNNSGRTYIQDITLDTYGHITGITSATETVTDTNRLTTFQVEDGDGTEVTISHGKEWKFVEGSGSGATIDINWSDTTPGSDADPYDLTFSVTNTDKGSAQNIFKTFTVTDTDSGYTWAETGNIVADTNSDTVTFVSGGAIDIDADATNDAIRVSHSDTSTQGSVNNSNGTVIQDVTLDGYGHVTGLASVDLDSRYVNVTGDTMTGVLTFNNTSTASSNAIRFGPGPAANDDAHIEWIGGSNAGSLRISTSDDDGTEAIVFGDYDNTSRGGTFTTWLSMNRSTFTWKGDNIFHDGYHPNADKWTTARTLSLTSDVTGSVSWDGSGNASISTDIAANVVGASELKVSGNGSNGQFLRSDGDGTFTWATPTDTNTDTTYSLKAQQTDGNNTNPNILLDASTGTDDTIQLVGSGATTITRNNDGQITISSTDTNTDTNTTYDLVSPGSGVLRLSDSANANDNITFVGSGATSVSSNSSHIIISSTDTNTTYDLVSPGSGVLRLSDSANANDNITFVGSGATSVSSNSSHIIISSTDTNTDTDTTYSISAVDSGTNAIIRLTAGGSGSGTDDVTLVAGSNITLTPSGDNITIAATDTNTTYSAGNGISLSGTTFSVAAGTGLAQNASGLSVASNGIGATQLNVSGNGTAGQALLSDGDGTFSWGDAGSSVTVSATAPSSPSEGELWWDEDTGNLFIYYTDTDTSQWVEASPNPNPFTYNSGTSTYTLTGNLTVTGDVNSNSDEKLKDNINTFENGLDTVKGLRGVRYDWKESGKSSIGLIAQEVEQILPELVATGEDDIKSVQYGNIVAVLIEAVKELSARVEELENK